MEEYFIFLMWFLLFEGLVVIPILVILERKGIIEWGGEE